MTMLASSVRESEDPSITDYVSLMKPGVMSLVIFSSFTGMVLAPGTAHLLVSIVAILCISLGAASAAVINMWYDRDIDAIMVRTQKRPIVLGSIDPDEALSLGIVIGFFAIFFMALCVNFLSAFLLFFTIAYYIVIYTMWVKRTTIQNIVIGGVAGALPPVIGWTAITNAISIESIILFAIILAWTPPHSWALALYRLVDYRNSGVPMMPVIKGELYTKKYMCVYSVIMVAISILPAIIGMSGIIYLLSAVILGGIFLYYAFALLYGSTSPKTLFIYSILYLFCIFLALIIDHYLYYNSLL